MENDNHHGGRPIGHALTSGGKGDTIKVELDMSNPAVAELAEAYFAGGRDAANDVLRRQQQAKQN